MLKHTFFLLFLFFLAGCGGKPDSSQQSNLKYLIPFYIYPDYNWNTLVDIKQQNPSFDITAIVNQTNGHFTSTSLDYKSGISSLSDAGIKVIGYVYTLNGTRDMNEVKADIDMWVDSYLNNGLSGMFFDEVPATADKLAYYNELTLYARSKGLNFTVLNPGTELDQQYVSQNIASVIVTGENKFSRLNDIPLNNTQSDTTKLALLIYETPTTENAKDVLNFATKNGFTYVYVTNDTGSNPWDTLSPYLQ